MLLLYVYGVFACVCICTPRVRLFWRSEKGVRPSVWRYMCVCPWESNQGPPTTLAESSFHSGSAFWDNRHTQTHGGALVSEVLTSCDYRPVPPCPAVCLWSEPAPRRDFDLTPRTRRNPSHYYVSWSGRAHGHRSPAAVVQGRRGRAQDAGCLRPLWS